MTTPLADDAVEGVHHPPTQAAVTEPLPDRDAQSGDAIPLVPATEHAVGDRDRADEADEVRILADMGRDLARAGGAQVVRPEPARVEAGEQDPEIVLVARLHLPDEELPHPVRRLGLDRHVRAGWPTRRPRHPSRPGLRLTAA